MNIVIGQLGLGGLTEQEKLEFVDYLNEQLAKEDAGAVHTVYNKIIKTKGFWSNLEAAEAVIIAIGYAAKTAKTAKRLPYFYDQALGWLKLKGRDTSHMDRVKKLAQFTDEATKENVKDGKDNTK